MLPDWLCRQDLGIFLDSSRRPTISKEQRKSLRYREWILFRRHSCSSSTNKREIRTESQSPILDYGWACGGGVGRGGGGVRRQATKAACGSCHLNFQGARTMRANPYRRRGSLKKAPSKKKLHLNFTLCPDINVMSAILGQNTKICILAYHNLCFCVFMFLGMLHYY